MTGDMGSFQQRGMVPRALRHLFQEIHSDMDRSYQVHVSFLEIYNEELYDLLAENPGNGDDLVPVTENGTTVVRVGGLWG